jgi:hypothetical protein
MQKARQTLEEVKSIEGELEASPSQHDDCGHYGGKPSITPHDSGHVGKTTLPTTTSELQMTARGTKVPGYSDRFAHEHTQSHAHLKAVK